MCICKELREGVKDRYTTLTVEDCTAREFMTEASFEPGTFLIHWLVSKPNVQMPQGRSALETAVYSHVEPLISMPSLFVFWGRTNYIGKDAFGDSSHFGFPIKLGMEGLVENFLAMLTASHSFPPYLILVHIFISCYDDSLFYSRFRKSSFHSLK